MKKIVFGILSAFMFIGLPFEVEGNGVGAGLSIPPSSNNSTQSTLAPKIPTPSYLKQTGLSETPESTQAQSKPTFTADTDVISVRRKAVMSQQVIKSKQLDVFTSRTMFSVRSV